MKHSLFRKARKSAAIGSYLIGYLYAPYSVLVKIFGKPRKISERGAKEDVEWVIQLNDGTVFTIYNWKNGKNYLGSAGKPVTKITEWHIGGFKEDIPVIDAALKAAGLQARWEYQPPRPRWIFGI